MKYLRSIMLIPVGMTVVTRLSRSLWEYTKVSDTEIFRGVGHMFSKQMNNKKHSIIMKSLLKYFWTENYSILEKYVTCNYNLSPDEKVAFQVCPCDNGIQRV